jgi:hypothetical protein
MGGLVNKPLRSEATMGTKSSGFRYLSSAAAELHPRIAVEPTRVVRCLVAERTAEAAGRGLTSTMIEDIEAPFEA